MPPVSTCSICYISGNLYCYGGNNPVRYVDPDGTDIGIDKLASNFTNGETIKDWKIAPCEGAFIIGTEGDKNNNWFFTIGVRGIAAAYLGSGTAYIKLYDKKNWENFCKDLTDSANQLNQLIEEYYLDRMYEAYDLY